jgi:broad specificity phosphatase PhoE
LKLSRKKIYLIRHGQTEFNRLGIVQGSGIDTSLNDYGRQQARAFFKRYREVPFDRIYTSALKRTVETVEDFLRNGVEHEPLAGLNEINWGKKEGQKISPESDVYYRYLIDEWSRGNTGLAIEGGESPEDVFSRIDASFDLIMSRQHERNVLICMHGRAMRIMLCRIMERPLRFMDEFKHTNVGLYLLGYNGEGFVLELENDTSHLG